MIPSGAWWLLGLLLFVVSAGWFRSNRRLRRRLEEWRAEGVLVDVTTKFRLLSGATGVRIYSKARIVSIGVLGMYIDSQAPNTGGQLDEVSYMDILALHPAIQG